MSPSIAVSPAATLVDGQQKQFSSSRKIVLLLIFCFANFLDISNNAALFPAIPVLENTLGVAPSQSAWIISAYQLTLASFLLISGRISDIYNPKMAFVTGVSIFGIFSICAGFISNKIAIIVFRALTGIAAALTIPSSFTLLVRVFPEPLEQARALGVFGGCGAVGNVLGLFIGAILVQYASYHWVFWFVGIVAIPIALLSAFIIPPEIAEPKDVSNSRGAKWKGLDLIGASMLTAALVLFIYALTSGSADGWATSGVLIPLIVSILLAVGFLYWETLIPPENAAIPPHTWFYTNFSVLFGAALYPLFWWSAIFLVYTTLWQDTFQWTVISTAIHMLPLGVTTFVMSFTGSLSRVFSAKWILLTGFALTTVATVLVALSGTRPDNYWPYVFPAFICGAAGVMLINTHTGIALFQTTPPSMAGTVGAMFNGALECGSAIGLAAFESIQTSVSTMDGGNSGQAAAFWFLLGVTLIETLAMLYFYRRDTDRESGPTLDDRSNDSVRVSEEKSDEAVKSNEIMIKEKLDNLPV